MQFSKSQQSAITLFVLMLLSSFSFAQSKMEYGIGIGIIYGDYHEKSNLPDGYDFDVDEARPSPSINGYVAYQLANNIKLTTSPGINFHLHHEPFNMRDLSIVYFHLPMGVKYNLIGDLSIMGDLFYDYLVNQSYEYRGEHVSVTERADTRNLYGASAGFAYDIGRYVEVQLTASHQFNSVNSFSVTGLNGDLVGDVNLKNRFIKLNLVFRG